MWRSGEYSVTTPKFVGIVSPTSTLPSTLYDDVKLAGDLDKLRPHPQIYPDYVTHMWSQKSKTEHRLYHCRRSASRRFPDPNLIFVVDHTHMAEQS